MDERNKSFWREKIARDEIIPFQDCCVANSDVVDTWNNPVTQDKVWHGKDMSLPQDVSVFCSVHT